MLHINKITIKNFRPYFGIKTFDFGEKNGVSIILGDNGIGKTSLIRAIKFVLYGEFDNNDNFKLKNEMNILAWEEQNFELYVALEFLYNDEKYVLRRGKSVKANVYGEPQNDSDFEDSVTLIRNNIILTMPETNNVLRNIIPKKISEYILFEGETISKYKDLLDKEKNQDIFDSIKKILGITTLENSKFDLKRQLDKYEMDRLKLANEDAKNQKTKTELNKYYEQLEQCKKNEENAVKGLESVRDQKTKCENILNANQRMSDLISQKNKYRTDLELINQEIYLKKNLIKEKLKEYKSYCYDFLNLESNTVPNDIQKTKEINEQNEDLEQQIKIRRKIIDSLQCNYCGRNINDKDIQNLNEEIHLMKSQKTLISDVQLKKLKENEQKISTLKNIISSIENKDFKKQIQKIEAEIQSKLIEKDGCHDFLNDIDQQINNLGGLNNIEETIRLYSIALRNEEEYKKMIDMCTDESQKIRSKIESNKKRYSTDVNFSRIDKKIEKTQSLINIFCQAIEIYSKKMRIKVQEDSSEMFRKISENKEYDHLEFNGHYGLKLIDINNRIVPNISSGYMTLITISLIYGLHKNSSLTGTIILDAPFSVLTNFHRDKIINAFQTLSPQVLLLVYRDQIEMENIRKMMRDKLINEFEIYQNREEKNSSYRTNIREVEEWLN